MKALKKTCTEIADPGYVYILTNPSFAGTFMPEERRNASGAYQGAKYFSFNGKVLDDMRKELETTSEEIS